MATRARRAVGSWCQTRAASGSRRRTSTARQGLCLAWRSMSASRWRRQGRQQELGSVFDFSRKGGWVRFKDFGGTPRAS
eukprot:3419654-Pyramimonas_sp.AAC.1